MSALRLFYMQIIQGPSETPNVAAVCRSSSRSAGRIFHDMGHAAFPFVLEQMVKLYNNLLYKQDSRLPLHSYMKEPAGCMCCLVFQLFVHHHDTVRWQYYTLMVSSVQVLSVYWPQCVISWNDWYFKVYTLMTTEWTHSLGKFRVVYYSSGNLVNQSAWQLINIYVLLMQPHEVFK